MDILSLKHIHFTGIKGVGMTALALCAQDLGIKVTGSDVAEIFVTDETLQKRGIGWNVGFGEKNLDPRPDLVITTGAHGGLRNPEVVAAQKMGIPVMTHAQALYEFTKGKEVIAVCGVGGKSTTCAMIATIFDVAGMHPSFAIGVGDIPSLGAPGRYDKEGKIFIVEADEYAISPGIDNRPRFSLLSPRVIVVTNIEHDHPDIYKTLEDTKRAFREFFEKLPGGGLLVANGNSEHVRAITKNLKVRVIMYDIENLELSIPGKFNQANATAAAAVAKFCKIPEEIIRKGLQKFKGIRRRFEKMGEVNEVLFYDDYAHMPNEISAILGASKEHFPQKRIIVIFQPHTYSRTKALFSDFAKSFGDADVVGIMDIYASARESDALGVSSELLTKEISRYHKNVAYTGKHEQTIKWIKKNSKSGDVVLTLGAGDIFLLHGMLREISNFQTNPKFKIKMNKNLIKNILFSSLTTLRIGGPIRYFAPAFTTNELFQLIKIAKEKNMPYLIIGGGSNLLVADDGFDGLVIQNLIQSIEKKDDVLEVGSGTDLQTLVWYANKSGISGFEKLVGIPGSVGGAVYGNVGAYGQTISDNILWVEVLKLKNLKTEKLKKEECGFGYRHSKLKETKDVILRMGFSITPGDGKELSKTSQEVVKMRMQKYHPGIACPGSFFKNVEADKLSKKVLNRIPEDKISFSKIPAGWLLEEVGAKGAKRGDVEIALWHGNLFINRGKGTAEDFLYLAKMYREKVKDKFGIELEPEVQLVGFKRKIF